MPPHNRVPTNRHTELAAAFLEQLRRAPGGAAEHVRCFLAELGVCECDAPEVLLPYLADTFAQAHRLLAHGHDPARSRLTQAVAEFLDAHYMERITRSSLARTLHACEREIATRFREETGVTVHEYLTRVRMTHALHLVARGEKIEAVMLVVGYRSKRNFYRQFRRLAGCTPARCRYSASRREDESD